MCEITIDGRGTTSVEEWNPMIRPRIGHSACYVDGNIISVSSNHEFDSIGTSEIYSVHTQTAVELKHRLPLNSLQSVATTVYNGRVYCIGGFYINRSGFTWSYVESDKIFFLDESGSWNEQTTTLLNARCGAAITTFQNKIVIAGGYGTDKNPMSCVEVFDPQNGTIQETGNLTRVRENNFYLIVINDVLYAAGGTRTDGMWVERMNSQTNTWELIGEFNDGNRRNCALAACGSNIYFFGGGLCRTCMSTWNYFNTETMLWASEEGPYQDLSKRFMRCFIDGQVVCITPNDRL